MKALTLCVILGIVGSILLTPSGWGYLGSVAYFWAGIAWSVYWDSSTKPKATNKVKDERSDIKK